jgi:hypothetical protein
VEPGVCTDEGGLVREDGAALVAGSGEVIDGVEALIDHRLVDEGPEDVAAKYQ